MKGLIIVFLFLSVFFICNPVLCSTEQTIALQTPPGRTTELAGNLTEGPCGGHSKGELNSLTVTCNEFTLGWKTLSASEEQKCTVSIAIDEKQQFLGLEPLDQTADRHGAFPCGGIAEAVETKAFKIPETLSSNEYTIQMSWTNADGTFYSCADVKVVKGADCKTPADASGNEGGFLLTAVAIFGLIGAGILVYRIHSNAGRRPKHQPLEESKEKLSEEGLEGPMMERAAKRPTKGKAPDESGNLEDMGSLGDDPELKKSLSIQIKAAAEHAVVPSTKSILALVLEKAFMDSIKRVVVSTQTDNVKEFITVKDNGKTSWSKTHFIFALDCSGSMKGSRWDSVLIGYETFLKRVQGMEDIYLSAFTFDTKVNPFCKEKDVEHALSILSQVPFTAKGTNYNRAMEYAIDLMNKSKNPDHLVCIIFLSDGLGGYPEEYIKNLMNMRENGKKIIFYSIACETDDDEDMIKMATELGGEHYKVVNAEASRLVFSAILKV